MQIYACKFIANVEFSMFMFSQIGKISLSSSLKGLLTKLT